MSQMRKTVYLVIGWLALGLGLIGVLLPVMPTVPFVLVAFWAFAKSSPRMSRQLLRHRHVGPPLRIWLRHNAISRRAKALSTITMAAGCMVTWALGLPAKALLAQIVVCTLVAAYILSRPVPPPTTPTP